MKNRTKSTLKLLFLPFLWVFLTGGGRGWRPLPPPPPPPQPIAIPTVPTIQAGGFQFIDVNDIEGII
ncbi:MAG: hypothetical protein HQM12_18590 [SAR324 cluster bacterium]|nr:hypothetical protein [SAR324 cluster bacterium]